ncbi:MAG TPA: hypothetical protein GXX64_03445 [Bacteroidales bacterium]|nr:hypothetical protein [Bacteroidales bacterium]
MAGAILRLPRKRYRFHIVRETSLIEQLTDTLPDDEVFKLISAGGFSSIGFVRFVADRTHIKKLTATTLRVGAKQLDVLDVLKSQGKLDHVRFVIGSVMRHNRAGGKTYEYYEQFVKTCEEHGWEYVIQSNHSKLLLFDTDAGKFVLETSSNLNENPSIEQFSFEKNAELYDFYEQAFGELFGGA